MPTVAVIGGGVVGLSVARSLVRRGAQVTLLERGRCGGEASAGNAGWVTPALSAPIPAPGVVRQGLRWMLDPESPLLIRPRPDPRFAAWLIAFARAARARPHAAGLRATLALAQRALPAFDALREDGVEFEMHSDGLLYLVRDPAGLERWAAMYEELHALGYEGLARPLDAAQVRELEPAVSDAVAGGLHGARERHVRPESLCRGLRDWLLAHGASIREHTAVDSLVRRGAGWTVSTGAGAVGAEQVVVAAGAWTRTLLERVGVRIALEGAKGYSITAASGPGAPRHPLYLTETKIGVTPFEGAVRFAGTLELAGLDLELNARRIGAVERNAIAYLREWRPAQARVQWAGLRPLLPDALPLVDAVPGRDGLFVATGHGILGITLGPATGEALAPLMLDGERPPELAGLGFARLRRR